METLLERAYPDLDGHHLRAVARMGRWGLGGGVIERVLGSVSSDAELPAAWYAEGDRWRDLADEAGRGGAAATERAYRTQSFWAYRLADFCYTTNTPEKTNAYLASVYAFEQISAGEVVPIEVKVEGATLPGYITGPDLPRDSPGVLLIYGADGNKEEHLFGSARALTARGIRMMVVDGPGQGHAVRIAGLPTRFDWEVVASACLDVFLDQTPVDPERIGLVGSSFGGYTAPRSFVHEPKFRACAVISGLYDVKEGIIDYYPDILPQLQYNAQLDGPEDIVDFYSPFSLKPIEDKLAAETRPVLVAHGGLDIYIPVSEAWRLKEAIGENCDMQIWEDGTHNLGSVGEQAMPVFWDWVQEHL